MHVQDPARSDRARRLPPPGIVIAAIVILSGVGWAIAQTARKSNVTQADAALEPSPIDGKRAYRYLQEICKIGPRPAGSAANARQRAMVAKHFELHGGVVREQPFTAVDPLTGAKVEMANLIGSWFPDRLERVVIGVHYDTRPFPDEDPDPVARRTPFIGANDGASGVAMLMEIAHHLSKSPTPWGVDLVLFDGEELVYGGGRNQTGEYFLGSRFFSREYARAYKNRTRTTPRYLHGFVLDMIADRDLDLPKEPHSVELVPRFVRDVWGVAKSLGVKQFRDAVGDVAVLDDHLPMNDAGIPTLDIIDFTYPHWHTAGDTPDKCSAESLEAVGRVVTAWLNRPKLRR
ncbi:MAG: M28 family peptidase [Isosphaeraceae bacterium]|nr:M28 family peptidase [Isosphaeraceae bacterium]